MSRRSGIRNENPGVGSQRESAAAGPAIKITNKEVSQDVKTSLKGFIDKFIADLGEPTAVDLRPGSTDHGGGNDGFLSQEPNSFRVGVRGSLKGVTGSLAGFKRRSSVKLEAPVKSDIVCDVDKVIEFLDYAKGELGLSERIIISNILTSGVFVEDESDKMTSLDENEESADGVGSFSNFIMNQEKDGSEAHIELKIVYALIYKAYRIKNAGLDSAEDDYSKIPKVLISNLYVKFLAQENQDLRGKLKAAERSLSEAGTKKFGNNDELIAEAERQSAILKNDLDMAEKKLTASEEENARLNEVQSEYPALEEELQGLKKTNISLKSRLVELTDEKKALDRAFVESKLLSEDLEGRLMVAEGKIEVKEEELVHLDGVLQGMQQDEKEVSKKAGFVTQLLEAAKNENSKLNESVMDLRGQLDDMPQRVDVDNLEDRNDESIAGESDAADELNAMMQGGESQAVSESKALKSNTPRPSPPQSLPVLAVPRRLRPTTPAGSPLRRSDGPVDASTPAGKFMDRVPPLLPTTFPGFGDKAHLKVTHFDSKIYIDDAITRIGVILDTCDIASSFENSLEGDARVAEAINSKLKSLAINSKLKSFRAIVHVMNNDQPSDAVEVDADASASASAADGISEEDFGVFYNSMKEVIASMSHEINLSAEVDYMEIFTHINSMGVRDAKNDNSKEILHSLFSDTQSQQNYGAYRNANNSHENRSDVAEIRIDKRSKNDFLHKLIINIENKSLATIPGAEQDFNGEVSAYVTALENGLNTRFNELIDSAKGRLSDLQDENDNFKSRRDADADQFAVDRGVLQGKFDAVGAEKDLIVAQRDDVIKERDELQVKLTDVEAERHSLQVQLDVTKVELTTTKADLDTVTAQKDELQTKLTAVEAELTTAKDELTAVTAQKDELQAQLDATKTELVSTKADLDTVTAQKDRLTGLHASEIADLKGQHATEIKKLTVERDDANGRAKGFKVFAEAALVAAHKRADGAETELLEAKAVVFGLLEEVNTLVIERNAATELVAANSKVADEAKDDHDFADAKAKGLETELVAAKATIASLRGQLDTLRDGEDLRVEDLLSRLAKKDKELTGKDDKLKESLRKLKAQPKVINLVTRASQTTGSGPSSSPISTSIMATQTDAESSFGLSAAPTTSSSAGTQSDLTIDNIKAIEDRIAKLQEDLASEGFQNGEIQDFLRKQIEEAKVEGDLVAANSDKLMLADANKSLTEENDDLRRRLKDLEDRLKSPNVANIETQTDDASTSAVGAKTRKKVTFDLTKNTIQTHEINSDIEDEGVGAEDDLDTVLKKAAKNMFSGDRKSGWTEAISAHPDTKRHENEDKIYGEERALANSMLKEIFGVAVDLDGAETKNDNLYRGSAGGRKAVIEFAKVYAGYREDSLGAASSSKDDVLTRNDGDLATKYEAAKDAILEKFSEGGSAKEDLKGVLINLINNRVPGKSPSGAGASAMDSPRNEVAYNLT